MVEDVKEFAAQLDIAFLVLAQREVAKRTTLEPTLVNTLSAPS
jgi:hypothetical protein